MAEGYSSDKNDYEIHRLPRVECPLYVILPSPEKLGKSIGSPGSDKTDTLRDFDLIREWITKSTFGGKFCLDIQRQYEYDAFIITSFNIIFYEILNTTIPKLPELLFWYYAGHGLSKESAKGLSYSSTPSILFSSHHATVREFAKEGRKVKGGELCLHRFGFCDLYGLLKPWIAAVKTKSSNANYCSKKNKHFVIILDSCYSGIMAEELKNFKDEMNENDPSFLKENSVTIQASCGPNEVVFGGYFTPCFVYLNDRNNADLLNNLKDRWMGMSNEEKNDYRLIEFPSPMVVTTGEQFQGDGTILEVTVQGFKLTLFQDPGFFKFCSIEVYRHQGNSLFKDKRALDQDLAEKFMTSPIFTLLDYKLKTMMNGTYNGSPMGMFLLEDPDNPNFAVCAHIHFEKGDTSKFERINLVHHKKPPMGCLSYIHKQDGLKFRVNLDDDATRLVQSCRDFVESHTEGRWNDITQWNMKGKSVHGYFRMKERSAWEDDYLEHIKQYDIPKVAGN